MAAPPTETAISRLGRVRATLALTILAALGIALGGCGSSSTTRPASFGWVRATAPPAGWPQMRIPAGDTMAYPPGWQPTKTDAGTASKVLEDARGRLVGYLNLTPQVPEETLRTWPQFRVGHNSEEHDSHVAELSAGRGLRFANGRGVCVRDHYTTKTAARYTEIACLVVGRHGGAVAIGAAPMRAWPRMAPQLERALASVRT
jgi:hypothetical protein